MAGMGDNTRILKDKYGFDTGAAREECLRLVQPLPEDRVLDVGTGSGWMAIVLARNGYDVTSVDLDEDAIGSARERAVAEGTVNLLHEVPQELGDLIPELHKRRKPKEGWLQFGLICLGLAVLWTATLVRHE
jgi:methylase of polypeptide subunit release factors